MDKPLHVFAALGTALAVGCGGSSATTPTAPPASPSPPPAAAQTARYAVTFDASWRADAHPVDFPANPHFSPLVGATHSGDVRFWRPEGLASRGIEAMAEEGSTSPLDAEVQAAIAAGTAYSLVLGDGIPASPGAASAELEIDRDHPLVTLVSMVAPSPDWFVGVSGLSLIESGDWVEAKVVTLRPWDAGTDSGTTYTSPNRDARPQRPIAPLEGDPVAFEGAVAPFGTFTFRRVH